LYNTIYCERKNISETLISSGRIFFYISKIYISRKILEIFHAVFREACDIDSRAKAVPRGQARRARESNCVKQCNASRLHGA